MAAVAYNTVSSGQFDVHLVMQYGRCKTVVVQEMGKVLRSEERVNAYAIFIAEPMAADWLKSELPFGKAWLLTSFAILYHCQCLKDTTFSFVDPCSSCLLFALCQVTALSR